MSMTLYDVTDKNSFEGLDLHYDTNCDTKGITCLNIHNCHDK